MKCPFCKKHKTRVIDSRTANRGFVIRRRRACVKCRRRFTTYERPEKRNIIVIKRDGSRELFDLTKIHQSIALACNKRPVSERQMENVVNRVEREILKRQLREVPSTTIGDLVLAELKRLDKVAYVRFASVYRGFSDVTEFIHEASRVSNRKR